MQVFPHRGKALRDQPFVNKPMDISHIEFFFQDSIGRVWGGSFNNGLLMFDGETFVKKTPDIGTYGIHCCMPLTGTDYLVGTRAGLFRLNLVTLHLAPMNELGEDEIVGLHSLGDEETLVFAAHRIVLLKGGAYVRTLASWPDSRVIQYLDMGEGRFLLLSDLHGLYTYSLGDTVLTPFPINGLSAHEEMLLCMLRDGDTLWIGSDQGLIMCNLSGQTLRQRIPRLEGLSMKSLTKDSQGNLWVGTNKGLHVFSPALTDWRHYAHQARDERSLLNDCVWSVYEDNDGNKWIGVDGGISFIPNRKPFHYVHWNDLVSSQGGNRISRILHDSKGNYWFGGVNGLGWHETATGESLFFEIQGERNLPDNTIRAIFEDSEGVIWIGTDGGIAWFDEQRRNFVPVNVEDPTSGRNSLWTYGITEDPKGNLWLATCSGGVFAINRSRLLETHEPHTVAADVNYHSESVRNRISYNACLGIVTDPTGSVWVNADRWIYQIKDKGVTTFSCDNAIDLQWDASDGVVWGATRHSLFQLSDASTELDEIDLSSYTDRYGSLLSMAVDHDRVWLLTAGSMAVFHKHDQRVEHLMDLPPAVYRTCYYDACDNLLWIGGVDGSLVLKPEQCTAGIRTLHPAALLSEVRVNGELWTEPDAAFLSEITLPYSQNSLSFRLSTGRLSQGMDIQSGYYYRMADVDKIWTAVNANQPVAEYPYLSYGKYRLELAQTDSLSGKMVTVRTVKVEIRPPWYRTGWFHSLLLGLTLLIIIGIIRFYRVRTRLRIAEAERQNTLQLSQMKMEFLTNMSHELKTPLSLILAPVSKLISSTKNPQSKALLQTVQQNAMRMNELIAEIIHLKDAPPDPHTTQVQIEVVEFARSVTTAFRKAFEDKDIQLDFQTSHEEIFIQGEPLRLELSLNNLLSNACKFTPKGGKVTVRMEKQDDLLRITVTDTGVGISSDDLPHVFDRFFQSDQHRELNKNGSGVGLSVVKKYVEEQQGEVSVQSVEGEGSTFTILLPVLPQTEADTLTNETPREEGSGGIKVLLVEDNREIVRFVTENLEGMTCIVAHNGQSGYEKALQEKPDVIVSDIMMPAMDGMEMSRLLKRNLETKDIPILLLTAKDSAQIELEAYRLGVDAFLSKPFSMEHLSARLRQLVASRASLLRKGRQQGQEEATQPEVTSQQESPDEKFIKMVTQLVEEHLDDPDLSVLKLAQLMGVGEKQVYRKLKLLTGNTTVDFIKSIRLKKAALLLRQKNFTVNEVMYMVGFSSPSYFARCFSEKYGKSPKVFMEEA